MRRVLLVRTAASADDRAATFADPCSSTPVDATGRRAARALGRALPVEDRCWASTAPRARETAALMGLTPTELSADLADIDYGRWRGRALADVQQTDPLALATWMADPDAPVHGGEPLSAVRERARRSLTRLAQDEGTSTVITHGGMLTVLLLEALRLDDIGFWQLDIAPASVTELHPRPGGRWRLARLNWTPDPATWVPRTATGEAPRTCPT